MKPREYLFSDGHRYRICNTPAEAERERKIKDYDCLAADYDRKAAALNDSKSKQRRLVAERDALKDVLEECVEALGRVTPGNQSKKSASRVMAAYTRARAELKKVEDNG